MTSPQAAEAWIGTEIMKGALERNHANRGGAGRMDALLNRCAARPQGGNSGRRGNRGVKFREGKKSAVLAENPTGQPGRRRVINGRGPPASVRAEPEEAGFPRGAPTA